MIALLFFIVYSQAAIINIETLYSSVTIPLEFNNRTLGLKECSNLGQELYYYSNIIQFDSVKEKKLKVTTNYTGEVQFTFYLKDSQNKTCNRIHPLDTIVEIDTSVSYRLIIISNELIEETVYFTIGYEYGNEDPIETISNVPFYHEILIPKGIPVQKNGCMKDKEENNQFYGYEYHLEYNETTKVMIHTCNMSESATTLAVINVDKDRCMDYAMSINENQQCGDGFGTFVYVECEPHVHYKIQVGLLNAPENDTHILLSIEYDTRPKEEDTFDVMIVIGCVAIAVFVIILFSCVSVFVVLRELKKYKNQRTVDEEKQTLVPHDQEEEEKEEKVEVNENEPLNK